MKPVLHLYTLAYPFGTGESFIQPEIPYLSAAFHEIHIHPLRRESGQRDLPANCQIHVMDSGSEGEVSLSRKLTFMSGWPIYGPFLKDIRYRLSHAGQLIARADLLSGRLRDLPSGIHYSYWSGDWATVLAELSRRGVIDGFVSRAHGFDLYDERARGGFRPYRERQLMQSKKIFAISRSGQGYLQERTTQKSKVGRSYLGTEDHGRQQAHDRKDIHMLSVSSIIPLKRVALIADLFNECGEHVRWTHIGGGDTQSIDEILGSLQRSSKTFTLTGQLPHDQVLDFMRDEQVDVLVNLSTTEGLPVTMMEALSMGIPIVATDVGAVNEIVNERTGILTSSDPDIEDLAKRLSDSSDIIYSDSFRDGARGFWEEHFSAAKNYPLFCQQLKELHAVQLV